MKNTLVFLVIPEICPAEELSYLIHHDLILDVCMNSQYGEEHGRKLLQVNLNFVARFMRKEEIL